ncbi:MFS general substrate transporter [Leucogyrophana mollusca]|uniref:MFS general substrate transporter n=1 Tax=Leucogyrophana mollusca TaxID=85980 RepID=A0ACB8BP23_9AGAM|nr:MFS general substrate transporter [Leucogyrophana mollusca]
MESILGAGHSETQKLKYNFGFLIIPTKLRHDPAKTIHFGLFMNISFGLGCTLVVANLYYCQPLLIQLSESFSVSYSEVARIPTLIQAGYCVGLLLISPLGDIVRRRQLILLLASITICLTIGLSITRNLKVFLALSFLLGVVNVTPQILLPFAADLAPPEHRSAAVSVVQSGLMLGILLARVVAGVIGNFTSWRVVYYMAVGVQCFVLSGVYWIIPDYPAKNRDLTYFDILRSLAKYAVTEPKLIQASLINIASMACWSNFWVTLTFLLGGPPYNYSTLLIGLMGLVGMLGIFTGPFVGRIIDRLVPWYATLIATLCLLVLQSIETAAGGISIAAVVIFCFGLDAFRQAQTVSLSTAIFSISVEARSRLNAVLTLSLFIGQVMGTSVGTKVFIQHGWRAASALSMAWYGWQLVILFLRGPNCGRYTWFGYEGGLSIKKSAAAVKEAPSGNTTPGDLSPGPVSQPLPPDLPVQMESSQGRTKSETV